MSAHGDARFGFKAIQPSISLSVLNQMPWAVLCWVWARSCQLLSQAKQRVQAAQQLGYNALKLPLAQALLADAGLEWRLVLLFAMATLRHFRIFRVTLHNAAFASLSCAWLSCGLWSDLAAPHVTTTTTEPGIVDLELAIIQ